MDNFHQGADKNYRGCIRAMDNNTVIEFSHVSKKFAKDLNRLIGYGIADIGRSILGLNTHSEMLRPGEFWAVDDVSFNLKRGEILGIIGSNGSGKTTVLKMISGILAPDKGEIKIRGKVGALIEVGAGFHPLLTGRENIYVNGSILGMSKREIDKKFKEIVKFADIGDFLDAPVKTYSSGMFVRLGFSVAVHCEPEVLLIDEVLAVGDLAFALKCHRKMSELRQKGSTQVIVSHNIQAIRNMCKKTLWLEKSKIKEIGENQRVCNLYEKDIISKEKNGDGVKTNRLRYDSAVKIFKVEFLDKNDQKQIIYKVGDYFKLRIHFDCRRVVEHPIFTLSIFNQEGQIVCSNYSSLDGYKFKQISGVGHVDFCITKLRFGQSRYICSVTLSEREASNILDWHERRFSFTVAGNCTNYGLVNPFPKWFLN